jgi:hypothetical protein
MAEAETGWKILFNAQDTANSVAYGIGFATAGGGLTPNVVWLTTTTGVDERDPVMARIGSGTPERYLVGWKTLSDGAFHLGLVNGSGTFLEGPEEMSPAGPGWGNRDDSFRPTTNGSVVWVEGTAGTANLTLYRYSDASVFSDGFESSQGNERSRSPRWNTHLSVQCCLLRIPHENVEQDDIAMHANDSRACACAFKCTSHLRRGARRRRTLRGL